MLSNRGNYMQVLITSPETDKLTRYLRVWSNKLIKKYQDRHSFLHLDKKRAVAKQVLNILKKKSVDVVLFNGHGSDIYILGNDGKVLFDGTSCNLLNGKVVHALSCNTAKTLGTSAIQQGAKGYVGYNEKFIVMFDREKPLSNPLKDRTASLFLDAAFTAPEALLNGKSPKEAVALTKEAYNRSITKALMSGIQSDDDQFVGLLLWDRDNIVAC